VHGFEGVENFGCSLVFDWFGMYGVAVIIVEDEHLCMPGTQWDDESASLVSEDFTRGCVFCACCKALVDAVILWVRCGPVVGHLQSFPRPSLPSGCWMEMVVITSTLESYSGDQTRCSIISL